MRFTELDLSEIKLNISAQSKKNSNRFYGTHEAHLMKRVFYCREGLMEGEGFSELPIPFEGDVMLVRSINGPFRSGINALRAV